MTTTPKAFAKAYNYFVIVRDADGTMFDDKVTGTAGVIRAIPFAFKTERTAKAHASRRGMFYVRPDGAVIDPTPAFVKSAATGAPVQNTVAGILGSWSSRGQK
jgi:hypothetical protein